MSRPAPSGTRFESRKLPGRDPARYVEQSISRAPTRFEATVTLYAPADDISRRMPNHWGTIEPIDERTCRYRTGDDDLGWLAVRITMLDVELDVNEPPELRERLAALSDRLTRATGAAAR